MALLHGLWFLQTGPVDDDYICYRYAHNLVAGHGLVFNLGERVEGFTTPLWVLMHAGWQALGGNSPDFAVGAGIAAFVLACLALAFSAVRRGQLPLGAFFLAAAPAMAWHSVAGLGTVFMALALLLAYLSFDRAPLRCGLFLAIACALRQEAALFLLPMAFKPQVLQSWRRWLAPVLVLLGWTLFRRFYYGQWLPTTYAAKKLPISADLAYGARYFLDATANFGLGVLLVLALLAASRKGELRTTLFTAGVVLHSVYVIWVGGDFMALSRFFVPSLPLLIAMAWPNGAAVLRQPRPGLRWGPIALTVFAMGAMQWNQVGDRTSSREVRWKMQRGFKQRWARLGTHFATLFPAETKVALSPIGAFGWTSGLYVVDILGLVNDSTADVKADLETIVKGHHKSDFDWVLDQDPEYVILGNGVRDVHGAFTICPWERGFYQSLQAGGRFPRGYRQASMDIGDGMPLDLFVRRDLPLPAGTIWVRP